MKDCGQVLDGKCSSSVKIKNPYISLFNISQGSIDIKHYGYLIHHVWLSHFFSPKPDMHSPWYIMHSFNPPPVCSQFLEFISRKIRSHQSKQYLPSARWNSFAGVIWPAARTCLILALSAPWLRRRAEGLDSLKHMDSKAWTGVAGSYAPIIKEHLFGPFIRAEAGLAEWRRANEGIRWLIVWAINSDEGEINTAGIWYLLIICVASTPSKITVQWLFFKHRPIGGLCISSSIITFWMSRHIAK